jgi:uncharacterized protein (TIGR02646 family)
MLRLTDTELSVATLAHLALLQDDVDAQVTFDEKVDCASRLWTNKTSSTKGRIAFHEIREKLIKMCVGKEICNYCEQNEASDIEHIAPKGLFPHLAFDWKNYLLACKHCNTGHKLDAMYVFESDSSTDVVFVQRGTVPVSHALAFVQPRLEDPMDLMELNITDKYLLRDFEFYTLPTHPRGSKEDKKIECTLEILGMGEKRSLHHYREHAYTNFKNRLREYVGVKNATSFDEIDEATLEDPKADPNKPFVQEQSRILMAIQTDILTADHPTVWQEMIRQKEHLPSRIQQLFAQAQELIMASKRD